MKGIILTLLILGLIFISCSEQTKEEASLPSISIENSLEIPNEIVNKSVLFYNNKRSLWYLNDDLYSGYAVVYHRDSILKEKFGILNGRKQNEAIHWYLDGHYQHFANYHKGKLQGEKKTWSPDSSHVLVSHLNYNLGKAHGQQKKWYSTGEVFKVLNLNMGREKGIQQAFRKNGVLFANYEARDGRIYGLKKAELCYGIEDGVVQE